LVFLDCVSEKSDKPKFRFSPDATPFVPKNFRASAARVSASHTKVSTLSVEAREFYPRNYIHQPEVTVQYRSFCDFCVFNVHEVCLGDCWELPVSPEKLECASNMYTFCLFCAVVLIFVVVIVKFFVSH